MYPNNNYFLNGAGANPFATNLFHDTMMNQNFRTARWTGNHLQLTLMCIPPNSDIGLEMHEDTDQFLYVAAGNGMAVMGEQKNRLNYQCPIFGGSGIFVPAGTWHNIINTDFQPLKLFSVYAPPAHPRGAVDVSKESEEMRQY